MKTAITMATSQEAKIPAKKTSEMNKPSLFWALNAILSALCPLLKMKALYRELKR
jgi:hypothetical protein